MVVRLCRFLQIDPNFGVKLFNKTILSTKIGSSVKYNVVAFKISKGHYTPLRTLATSVQQRQRFDCPDELPQDGDSVTGDGNKKKYQLKKKIKETKALWNVENVLKKVELIRLCGEYHM
jgi:hypothetical protein